jgi:transposase
MTLLTVDRILNPSSKKRAYEYKDMFFERFDFELHHVYRALTHFSKIAEECQCFISDQINKKFGRDTSVMYFDVTNFHFEIDETDNLRKHGKEKNNRPDPIVQMALAVDANGIPLYYRLFSGNTHDSKTFIPVFKDVCIRFNPGRVIAVADMGCASSDNIYFLKGGDRDKRVNGYVFSFSIRKSIIGAQYMVPQHTLKTSLSIRKLVKYMRNRAKSYYSIKKKQKKVLNTMDITVL